jgi:tetratricopeptide (TPR) repeat protein
VYGTSALVELAKIELGDGHAEAAERLLSEVIAREPLNGTALYNRSLALQQLGRVEEAEATMQKSRELEEKRRRFRETMERVNADASDIDARCEAAELLIELGDRAGAASLLEAVLARDPDNQRARKAAERLGGGMTGEGTSG